MFHVKHKARTMNNETDLAVLQASSVSARTLADDTLRITFDFIPRDAPIAFKLFGQRGVHAAIALLKKGDSLNYELSQTAQSVTTETNQKTESEKEIAALERPWGKYAATLYRNGFFFAPKLHLAVGTDQQFRHWIQRQPSAVSGNYSEWVDGEGRCIAAHVRRSSDTGLNHKPPYSCIPLTDTEHREQHQHGESSLGADFEQLRNHYLIDWIKTRLYEIFKVGSLTEIHPLALRDWCVEHDLINWLPKLYRDYQGDV